jgi:rubrerythrin
MKCDICNREENEFKAKFAPIIKNFQKQIEKIDEDIKNTKEIYAKNNGFTNDAFDKIKSINKSIMEMKINAFLGNKESFLKLEPNLEMLYTYITKYRPQISNENTLQNLSDIFVLEPNETRYSRQIYEITYKKDALIKTIETIKNKKGLFYEVEVPFSAFEFEHNHGIAIEEIIKKYYENGEEIINSKKIILCPYCSYLFKKSSEAAYQVIHAHDNDWDDWGDDDDDY